jgi:hypothetical protein
MSGFGKRLTDRHVRYAAGNGECESLLRQKAFADEAIGVYHLHAGGRNLKNPNSSTDRFIPWKTITSNRKPVQIN